MNATRIEHTYQLRNGGGLFTVAVEYSPEAIAAVGPGKLKAHADSCAFSFVGMADCVHTRTVPPWTGPTCPACGHGGPIE